MQFYYLQATGVKGEVVAEPTAKRHRVGIATDVAKTTTPGSSDPVAGVPSQRPEMIADKNKSVENVMSSSPRTTASLMQHGSTGSRQTIRSVAPTGAPFLMNRYKLDNRPTSFRIIPPLPPGLTNVNLSLSTSHETIYNHSGLGENAIHPGKVPLIFFSILS